MLLNILSVITLITIVTANFKQKPCESRVQSVKLFPSTGETVEWDLKDFFFQGSYLSYSLSPSNTQFQIQKPFAQLTSPKPHVETINKVVATRAMTAKGQRTWMNHFAFINQDLDRIELYYSEGKQDNNFNPPQFSKKISVSTNTSLISCLGVEYVNQDLFILDCLDSTKLPFTNKFVLVNKLGNLTVFENQNPNLYNVNTRRISQLMTFTNKTGSEYTFLLRSTPAFATQYSGLDNYSIIEVFQIATNGTPTFKFVLDTSALAVLLNVEDKESFTFSLIDFKVFPSGLIYILTADDGVYILEIQQNGKFAFVDKLFTNPDQAYGFDVASIIEEDGTLKEVITILYDDFIQILEEKEPKTRYVLEFIANYPAIIAISQQFLIIQNKGVTYLFSTEYQDFIHKETIEGAKGYIINPFITELVVITPIESIRISLTHGLLRFPNTNIPLSSLTSIQLIAKDDYQQQCIVNINYKIINSTDYSVLPIDELKLQDLVYDYPGPMYIQPLVSGPNLNYFQVLSDDIQGTSVVAKITQFQEMILESISLPPSTQIVYSDVLILDKKDERFALLVQTQYKVVIIYHCHIQNSYTAISECVQYTQNLLNITLTQNNFVWWNQGLNIQYLTVETDYSVVIRESKINQTTIVGSFNYSEDVQNKISSVTILKDRFYLILGNKKQIDIRLTTKPYDIEYSITETMMRARGFTGNWNPQRIYGNRVIKSYIFFVANEDNVIVADFHTQLTIIKTISLLSKGTINLAVGIEKFFIIFKSSIVTLVQEYDLTNLNSIQLMKNLPLYWYTLQTPLQTDFCSDTGVFFVRGYDRTTAQTVILTYGPGRLLRDSLLKVIPLGKTIPDGTSITMSSAGSNQMILYVNSGTVQKVYSYFLNPVFTIYPNYDSNAYFTAYTLKFQVSNFNDITPALYSQTLNLINTQITIKVKQTVLDNQPLNINKTDQIFDLSRDLFDGQVVQLNIDCEDDCDDKIKPIQTVQQIGSGLFKKYHIIDTAPLSGSRTLYLANKFNKRVFITDSQNELITSYSILLSENESDLCDHVVATDDGQYIFTTCTSNNIKVVQVAKCTLTGELECHQFGTIQTISENIMISQIEVYEQYLFILNSDPNNPKSYEGSLNVYKWVADASYVTFELNQQFNRTFFGQKPSYFSSFYIQPYIYSYKYIKVILLEPDKILNFIDGIFDGARISWYSSYQSLDLYVYINQQGFFVSFTSQFLQIKNVATAISVSSILNLYVLITTDTSAHYAIQFDLQVNYIYSKSILYILNQYSHWQALNKLTVSYRNGYVVIPYTDNTYVLLASYFLPDINVQGQPLVKFVGGTVAYYDNPKISEFVAYIPSNIALTRLYANIYRDSKSNENLLTMYNLNSNYQIQILNSDGTIQDQFILLTLSNEFTQDSGVLRLEVTKSEIEIEQEVSVWQQIINFIW